MQFQRISLFFGVGLLLLILTHRYANLIINTIIPLYEWMVHQIDYRFDKTMLYIANFQGESYLQLDVEISQPFWLGLQKIAPTQPIYNSTGMAVANVLQPIVLIFTIVLAWPVKHCIVLIYRILCALPVIVFLMLFDIPFQLVNSSWQGLEQTLKLNIATTKWFAYWSDFLNGGGLMALSITGGLLIIALVDIIPNAIKSTALNVNSATLE
ncbi:hypothetical protein [Methylotenera sp.]|uniref:hypothetical protein n=1 Tax=Methylotenera sp. TaxID=2051956 RepID=UPI0024872262|nr:hypothetical protein [Methylotenera sp.]MDI1361806.1 hypothetical protein [Methylotenera sp.]